MNPVNVFQLELFSAFARPRTVIMRLGLAFLVGLPFVMIAMPVRIKVAGLIMLTVFISFFGAAVGLVRSRNEDRLTRLRILPIPDWLILGDLVLANTVIDFLQMGPLLCLFLLLNSLNLEMITIVPLTGSFIGVMLLLNLLGLVLGWAMRSNPEVHLTAGIGVAALAFFSGLFPVPDRAEGLIQAVSVVNPVAWLTHFLESIATGTETGSALELPMGFILFFFLAVVFLLRGIGLGSTNKS